MQQEKTLLEIYEIDKAELEAANKQATINLFGTDTIIQKSERVLFEAGQIFNLRANKQESKVLVKEVTSRFVLDKPYTVEQTIRFGLA